MPEDIPAKDVFCRVLMDLRPEAFRACFVIWLEALPAETDEATSVEESVLAVDGKTSRRSHGRKNGLDALHSVTVWASDSGLSLGQMACAEKSEEITAIPELLKLVGHRAIITIDAMEVQQAIETTITRAPPGY